jgi:integral membrane sensor domain MASE1
MVKQQRRPLLLLQLVTAESKGGHWRGSSGESQAKNRSKIEKAAMDYVIQAALGSIAKVPLPIIIRSSHPLSLPLSTSTTLPRVVLVSVFLLLPFLSFYRDLAFKGLLLSL